MRVLCVMISLMLGLISIYGVAQANYASNCSSIKQADPLAADGVYTIDPDGSGNNPAFQVYCHDMNSTPKEYIELISTSDGNNFSMYKSGGVLVGEDVITTFSKIRLIPGTLVVAVWDTTFAISTGSLYRDGQLKVSKIGYASAGDCIGSYSQQGQGNVNLVGTPFRVADDQIFNPNFQPSVSTYHGAGSAIYSNNRQVVDITGGGYCGKNIPMYDNSKIGLKLNFLDNYITTPCC